MTSSTWRLHRNTSQVPHLSAQYTTTCQTDIAKDASDRQKMASLVGTIHHNYLTCGVCHKYAYTCHVLQCVCCKRIAVDCTGYITSACMLQYIALATWQMCSNTLLSTTYITAVRIFQLRCNTHCDTPCNTHCDTPCNTPCNTHLILCPHALLPSPLRTPFPPHTWWQEHQTNGLLCEGAARALVVLSYNQ